jgi:hypothetical protein
MKKVILLNLALISSLYATQPIIIEREMTVRAAKGEQVFPVKDDSVRFNDSVIREMAIGEDVTVAYKNTSKEKLSPKFTLKIYNKYGFLLTQKKVGVSAFGGVHLKPGELGAAKIYLDWIDYKEAFRHSNFTLRGDFSKAAWVSISKANFKIKQ